MKTVLCFGNEFIKEDSLAKEIVDEIELNDVKFVKCNNADDILEYKNDDIIILDVVKDVHDVIVIDDTKKLKERDVISLHDFDLQFFLKILKNLNKINKIRIIGLPQKGDKEKIKENIKNILKNK